MDIIIASIEVTVVVRALKAHLEQVLGHVLRLEDDTAHDSLLIMFIFNQVKLILRFLSHIHISCRLWLQVQVDVIEDFLGT